MTELVKPAVQILLEDVQRILRHYPGARSNEAEELRERVGRLLGAMKQKRLTDQQVFAEWKPTEANIRALPAPIRKHIEDCDHLVRENEGLREMLSARIRELDEVLRNRGTRDPDTQQRIAELQEICK